MRQSSNIAQVSLVWMIAIMLSCVPLYAEETWSPFTEFNEMELGKLSGRVQLLGMHRDNDLEASDKEAARSLTAALTLDYVSPEFEGFKLGGQFLYSHELGESGAWGANGNGPAYTILNDGYSILNNAYLKYNFEHLNLSKSSVIIGRQTINLNFARSYAIRHKAQAFEAIVLDVGELEGWKVQLGHLERFSSWSSRTDLDSGPYSNKFLDISDVLGVDYDTNGMQFAEITNTSITDTSINAYGYYGEDLFTTTGAKVSHTIDKFTINLHYACQKDNGRFTDVDSEAWEAAIGYKDGGLTLLSGVMHVAGDEAKENFQVPFRTSFTIDPQLMWYTDPFKAGSKSAFLKTVYKWDKNLFYMLYTITDHDDSTRGGAVDQELDFVVSHKFSKAFYVTAKIGFGERDNGDGKEDNRRNDFRLFVGYKF